MLMQTTGKNRGVKGGKKHSLDLEKYLRYIFSKLSANFGCLGVWVPNLRHIGPDPQRC